ncbi:MAG TPA: hypothetical protein PKW33_08640 [Anaerolineaceae bacterium]|nr:hypothetical protein [Anaerolineaceae bacterium]HPN51642.1 hypothetical protein [Anaerolineaceae bacterium]
MEISFFWQIVDVEAMVMATDDVPGDICFHARSGILQSISQVTLETFLDTFNSLIHDAVLGHDDPFYAGRGVRLHAVEVRSVTCKDPDTNRILQDIIRETTGRISRLQKQQGESEILLQQRENENEIMLKQLAGEIEAESLRARLLEARVENDRRAALTAGEAEALQVRAFFDSLGDGLTNEQKTALFNTLRKQDAIEALSQGTAQMYFTPADIDLSIETRNTPRT